MKYLLYSLTFVALLLQGCNDSKRFDRDRAMEILQKENRLTDTISENLPLDNKFRAISFHKLGFDTKGYCILDTKASKNNINFTAKAKPYLMGKAFSKKESVGIWGNTKSYNYQKISIITIEVTEATGLRMSPTNDKAIVKVRLRIKELSPFAPHYPKWVDDAKAKLDGSAYFKLYDDGWRLEKKPGMEFMF